MYSLKFGGTSMGSAENITNVADIIVSHPEPQKVVTVSAMSGVTNMLLSASECAISEDSTCYKSIMKDIEDKHLAALDGLVKNEDLYKEGEVFITERIKALKEFLDAISTIGEISPRSYDVIVSEGEILSAFLLAKHMQGRGEKSAFINLENSIVSSYTSTNTSFFETFSQQLHSQLSPLIKEGVIPICTGFFGRIPGGIISAVGRGYSDFTAALIGKACQAKEIQIWTDVSGILSTDPRIVSNAHVLEELSFDEASELANFGAKVIHPQTIWPAVKNDIIVRIKNTMKPLDPGTAVTRNGKDSGKDIKSVTAKKGITVLTMQSAQMQGHGIMGDIFNIFAKHDVSVDLISTSEVSISVTIEYGMKRIENVISELKEFCNVDMEHNKAIVAIIGQEMREEKGIAGTFFSALGDADINVRMISQGASEMNISAVICEDEVQKAIEVVHGAFFQ